ncbi:MAG: VWA-like domain-containing protein [Gammaproteobacteria bacterium]|nr:VWA-like domain-containing protein [Gammaproteobacteria bacterium]MDX2486151.1 VWA-like domain-containing protein [Gammaproteobacteria bacterium]
MILKEIEQKLATARTRLILDRPFLGALVLRLPLVAAERKWCKTTATDARKLYYNPDFIDSLTLQETEFMLAHEALHCGLAHFARRENRLKWRWDIACDYAINPLLLDEGLTAPFGILYDRGFAEMTAEEIYPYLDKKMADQTIDQHIYDAEEDDGNQGEGTGELPSHGNQSEADGEVTEKGGGSDIKGKTGGKAESDSDAGGARRPRPLSGQEREDLSVQWQQRLAGAAQQAMQAGKLAGSLARLVDHMLQPSLPWRMLLARYLSYIARNDYSYMRPSNRRDGPAIFPSLRSTEVNIVVVIDTSGSISNGEISEFLSEINAIKGQLSARITLLACDAKLDSDCPWRYEPWEEVHLPEKLSGGGGTSFIPPFQWLQQQDIQADLLVYFTDAEGEFPAQEPAVDVLWLVKGKSKVPFGTRVQLN